MAAEPDLWTFRSLVAGLSTEVSNELFFSIAKAMYLSETAADQRPQRTRMREHYADLLACVDKLERSYSGDLMGYEPTKTAALLEGLQYARSDLTGRAREAEDFFAEFVPTRNSNAAATRHANFIATVSTGMEKALGQPHDAEVAKLARFMLGQAVSEGKVRKARRPRQV